MMDIFPMNDNVNFEIQMVGHPIFKVFHIKQNKVGCWWIHNSNGGKQSPPLTWEILENLKSWHGMRFLGQIFNYGVALNHTCTWIKFNFWMALYGGLNTNSKTRFPIWRGSSSGGVVDGEGWSKASPLEFVSIIVSYVLAHVVISTVLAHMRTWVLVEESSWEGWLAWPPFKGA